MSALSEDELADSLTWSDQSFPLNEFVDEYPLPQVVRVVRGYDGGEDSATLGYGEVLTLHALRETPMLAGEDKRGRLVAIRLDCPYKVQVLPQASDGKYNRCGVEDIPSLYPKVKFLQVIGAHYGPADDSESTTVGDIVEIMSIEKRQKRVKVRNPETSEQITLSSDCSAVFMPLLDWKSYSVKDLKNHFSFPIRVRFMVGNESSDDDETLGLISKVSDFIVLEEFREVLVITTTTSSCVDLKFCYEIPKDLEVKVEVPKGFLSGDRHYQEVVATLGRRFDVSRFMNTHLLEICKHRDVIKGFDYESHKELFPNISRPPSRDVTTQDDSPVLPPRRQPVDRTTSVPLSPPDVPGKKAPLQKADSIDEDGNPRPPIAPRPKPRGQSVSDIMENETAPNPATLLPKECPYPTSSSRPQPPPKRASCDDPSASIYTMSPVSLFKELPPISLPIFQRPANLPAEGKPEAAKPPPIVPRVPFQSASPIIPSKPRVTLPKAPQRTIPDRSEQAPNPAENASNDPKPPPQSPPSIRPPPKIPKGARMVLPIPPPTLRPIPQPPTKPNPEKLERISQHVPEVPVNKENSTKDDDNYEELAPCMPPKDKIVPSTPSSDTDSRGDGKSNSDFIMVKSEPSGTGWETEDPYAVVAKIPQDLSRLSVNDVSALLSNLNMECYVKTFQDEMVDGNLLKSLDDEALQSLDVSAFHTKKLTRFISGWRPKV